MRYKVPIIEHVGDNFKRMTLDAPEIAQTCVPGQFVHVLCADPKNSNDPLLRRPFSIHDADADTGRISILYEVRGRGTALLGDRLQGEEINIIGPLGKGFSLPEDDELPIFVSGGIGAAPLYFLACRIVKEFGFECIMGARTAKTLVCNEEFKKLSHSQDGNLVCTNDGTLGTQALVTELLIKRLDSLGTGVSPIIYACGPTPMLKAVSKIAVERGIRCQISTEAKMACGVGACMGCVIKVKDGDSTKYVRCCKEGPVFNADEIIWD